MPFFLVRDRHPGSLLFYPHVMFSFLPYLIPFIPLNSALGTFAYWDNVSTGENGAKSLTMSKAMRTEHMYLVLVRCLNGSTDLYPPYGYLLCMRLNAWKAALIGEEHEVISKEISSGKLTLTFKNTQHTRLVVYEVM